MYNTASAVLWSSNHHTQYYITIHSYSTNSQDVFMYCDRMFSSVVASGYCSPLQLLTLNQACKGIHKQTNMCCVKVFSCVCTYTRCEQCVTLY